MKITIIGSGNMGGAIAKGLSQSNICCASDITCTAKSAETLEHMREFNPDFHLSQDNSQAIIGADIIILAVKPWLIETVTKEIRPSLQPEKQMIISVAAGITLSQLTHYVGTPVSPALFQVIPNTAIEVKNSMTLVAAQNATEQQTEQVLALFNELGKAILIDENQMEAGMILASCGTAFALRYIRASMEGGVELGMKPKLAQEIIAQTVKGAAELLLKNKQHPEVEIDKVTTPGGITIKGVNEMEAKGFTNAVISGLKACRSTNSTTRQ